MKLVGLIAGATCVVAGGYLLQTQAVGTEGNWLETIAHGMGIYFIGKGIFVAAVLWRAGDQAVENQRRLEALERLAPVPKVGE